jgi:uncharacterized protein (DUF58 family)
MLTQRGWWLFLALAGMLICGILGPYPSLILVALVALVWFFQEWLRFVVSVRVAVLALEVDRQILDGRGPVTTLWAGRTFEVRVTLRCRRGMTLEYVLAEDAVPFGVDYVGGDQDAEGPLHPKRPLSLAYRVRCISAGIARFEGVRVRIADLQSLFYHAAFVRSPVVLRVLPLLSHKRSGLALTKRVNELPPPGVHRHRRPGSGSELLDLRDYLPGDPPKTIAWKISARRDRLITKEFESEVPIRCTLFVDTSASVRVQALCPPTHEGDESWRPMRSLDRIIEIAAAVVQANVATRDLTVLCLFDENAAEVVKPDRTGSRLTQMLHRLAEAAALEPTATHVAPDSLVPLAYSFAHQVYPDLLTPDINGMSLWMTWFGEFPGRRRVCGSFLSRIYRARLFISVVGALGVPMLCSVVYAAALAFVIFTHRPQDIIVKTMARGLAITVALSALSAGVTAFFLLVTSIFGARGRRALTWRKRLAALLAHRYDPMIGGVSVLLEDEDRFSLLLQRFLAEHRVPYSLPLYDTAGQYLFRAPGKLPVLGAAIIQAVGRGRDNELFVLLVDVLELDQELAPVMRAVKVALGRHHQVVVVCPWPPSIALPAGEGGEDSPTWVPPADPAADPLPRQLAPLTTQKFHAAYERIRHVFGAVGVQVVCAASEHPIAIILDRIERLRRLRRVH